MNKNPLEFMLTPEIGESEGAQYSTCFLSREVMTELSSDFTLPDYYPEIRKLLRIETNVSPSGRYIGGGSVEFSGKVDYEMVYVTGDGTVASAPLGCDYSFDVPVSRPENASDPFLPEIVADSVAESATGRVTSPRKVGIKCRLRSRVRGYCMSEYGLRIDGGAKCERLTEEILCADSRRYMSEELTVSAQIPCETELITPVFGRADACIKDVSASGGLVTVAGEVKLKILCTEEGLPKDICESLPFSCEIETDIHGDMGLPELWTAFPHVTDTDVTVEDGGISARVVLICCADMHRNSPLTVVKDLYSTEGVEILQSETMEYGTVVAAGGETVKFNQALRLGSLNLTEDSRIIDAYGVAEADGCTCENGKINITGRCRVNAVIWSAGEYSAIEDSVPFSLAVSSAQKYCGDPKVTCRMAVHGVECRIDGGSATVSGNVYLSYAVTDGRSVVTVKSAEIEREQSSDSGIIVCYPSSGQTMWSVAKKYRVPVASLASANDLPMSAVAGPLPENVRYIVICK